MTSYAAHTDDHASYDISTPNSASGIRITSPLITCDFHRSIKLAKGFCLGRGNEVQTSTARIMRDVFPSVACCR